MRLDTSRGAYTNRRERTVRALKKEVLQILVEGTPAAPFLENGNDRLFGSVRSTASDSTKSLEYVCAQSGAPLSVRQWVKSGTIQLFLPYQADQIAALKSVKLIVSGASRVECACRLFGVIEGVMDIESVTRANRITCLMLSMHGDRWRAGSALMQAQNLEAWNVLMAGGRLTTDNSAALRACRDAAAKTKTEQHCGIVVPAP